MSGEKRKREEVDEEEERLREEAEFENGPMSILKHAIRSENKVLIFCRNSKKLTAKVKAFDRHMNMVLEDVQELWTEIPKVKKGEKAHPQNKFRYLAKVFLRGDNVILVVKNPAALIS
eukprot:TRINITY_DN15425_c0_g1_i1.p2 TRINITY_DN15425_c0_g1~~TRINITY_DN15425_c0_g1_i1.p2  ORF type:complete len:118 (+),score=43.67 TRINITY_DN15425_c0_g1_i1:253-606(+)